MSSVGARGARTGGAGEGREAGGERAQGEGEGTEENEKRSVRQVRACFLPHFSYSLAVLLQPITYVYAQTNRSADVIYQVKETCK